MSNAVSREPEIGVLLVENNPYDRLVIDEILVDTDFKLIYSQFGKPVHSNKLYKDLLNAESALDDYPIVLFDLGLDKKGEKQFLKEEFVRFLSDHVAVVNLINTIKRTPQKLGLKDKNQQEKLKNIEGLWFLIKQMHETPRRIHVIISHFTNQANEETMKKILITGWQAITKGVPDTDGIVSGNTEAVRNLVFNKGDLSCLEQYLNEALKARKKLLSVLVNFDELTYWPTQDLMQGDNNNIKSLSDMMLKALFFISSEVRKVKGKKTKGENMFFLLDHPNGINLKNNKWENVLNRFLPDDGTRKFIICYSVDGIKANGKDKNVLLDVPSEEIDKILKELNDLPKSSNRDQDSYYRNLVCRFSPHSYSENVKDMFSDLFPGCSVFSLLPIKMISEVTENMKRIWAKSFHRIIKKHEGCEINASNAVTELGKIKRNITIEVINLALRKVMTERISYGDTQLRKLISMIKKSYMNYETDESWRNMRKLT